MADFSQSIQKQQTLSLAEQKQAGRALPGDLTDEQRAFLQAIGALIDAGSIDPAEPRSFLNMDVYASLDEMWQDKIDLALSNIARLMTHIYDFWKSKETPDESPQLATMIEQLWQMKQRIEEHHDVFKF